MRRSLRFKVALAFVAATIALLVAQALGVHALAESQEERLIRSVIADDMRDLLESYRTDPASLPPLDPLLHAYVSQEGGLRIALTELLTIICRCTVQDHAIIHATRRPHRKVFIDRNYGSNLGIKQAASCRVRGKGAQTYCRIGCFRTIGRAGTDGRAIGGNSSSCPRRGSELPNLFSGGGQRSTLSRILCIGAPRSRIVRRGVLALRSSLRPE